MKPVFVIVDEEGEIVRNMIGRVVIYETKREARENNRHLKHNRDRIAKLVEAK